ncbi:glutaminase domain-containing protein [Ditylenchus destructor]|nr:glutaminase domain-containing protein [Ditylenchus destructor]
MDWDFGSVSLSPVRASCMPDCNMDYSTETLNTIGEILNRKRSVVSIMSKTAEGLAHSFDRNKSSPEDLVYDLFKLPQRDEASIGKLISVLRSFGLREDDPRLRQMMEKIREFDAMNDDDNDVRHFRLNRTPFKECVHPCISLISQALRNQLIVPNWCEFTSKIRDIFEECRAEKSGVIANYIPQLARQDPHRWGLSICTIDGQRFSQGDSRHPFCVQSVSKAFNYAIVASDLGADFVHSFVGHEPSGRLFNEICLDANGKPHNPLINAGAIIVTSLLKKGLSMADRYDFAFHEYRKLAGGGYVGFNNATFLSERDSADRNYALSYYMKENKCFPPGIQSLREELDFYFQLCSLETHCESAAVMAATLANGGVCPLTNDRCIDPRPCRDVLSLMYSCGMYDYSGQFAFHVGLPAKSGVSGAMIVVVPNLMGICLWSPPLDKMGNSTRGVLFCQKLIETFNFHNYDSLLHADSKKIDPRRRLGNKETDLIVTLLFACKNGDLETIRRLFLQGVSMNLADYDGRTALHLAACEGHTIIVKFLLHVAKVDHTIKDRWGRTALDDARQFHQISCVALLLKVANKRSRICEDRRLVSIGERDSGNSEVNDAGAEEEFKGGSPTIGSSEEDENCGIMMMGDSHEKDEMEEKHLKGSLDRLSLCTGHGEELVLSEPDNELNGMTISKYL